jgi:NAD(P)-dependent dehydrogenase (short-subunit alcohol dehydrogenase family)
MSAELAGKSFLVTGAASGIGRATAVARPRPARGWRCSTGRRCQASHRITWS